MSITSKDGHEINGAIFWAPEADGIRNRMWAGCVDVQFFWQAVELSEKAERDS